MRLGVVDIHRDLILDRLGSAHDINSITTIKSFYLWAVTNRWPPLFSGLAGSQSEVEHIARQHGIDSCIIYDLSYPENLNLLDRAVTYGHHPIFSFIERSTGRYFVCAWANTLQFLCDVPPIIEKDRITRDELLSISQNWNIHPQREKSWNASFLQAYIRRREAKRKYLTPKTEQGFVFVEFLYSPEYEWMLNRKRWHWQRHRIVKKTERTIFVEESPYQGGAVLKTGWQAFIVYTVMIDRAELESTHQFHHYGRHKTFFERGAVPELKGQRFIAWEEDESIDDEVIEIPLDAEPWALTLLNLTWPTTEAEIKAAFNRISIKAHPDKGGNRAIWQAAKRARDCLLTALVALKT